MSGAAPLNGKPTSVPALIRSDPGASFRKFSAGKEPSDCRAPSAPVGSTLRKSPVVTVTPPFQLLKEWFTEPPKSCTIPLASETQLRRMAGPEQSKPSMSLSYDVQL